MYAYLLSQPHLSIVTGSTQKTQVCLYPAPTKEVVLAACSEKSMIKEEYGILGSLAICLILEGVVLLFVPTHQVGGGIALLVGLLILFGTAIAVLKTKKTCRLLTSHKKIASARGKRLFPYRSSALWNNHKQEPS